MPAAFDTTVGHSSAQPRWCAHSPFFCTADDTAHLLPSPALGGGLANTWYCTLPSHWDLYHIRWKTTWGAPRLGHGGDRHAAAARAARAMLQTRRAWAVGVRRSRACLRHSSRCGPHTRSQREPARGCLMQGLPPLHGSLHFSCRAGAVCHGERCASAPLTQHPPLAHMAPLPRHELTAHAPTLS